MVKTKDPPILGGLSILGGLFRLELLNFSCMNVVGVRGSQGVGEGGIGRASYGYRVTSR